MRHIFLLSLALFIAACGPVRNTPLEGLLPTASPDASRAAGPVQLSLRVGEEWLELVVQNTGTATLEAAARMTGQLARVNRLE